MTSAIRQIPLDTATHHHSHDFHQVVIGLKGQAEFEIEGLGGSISALSGCIVPANHVHYYAGTGDNKQLILDLPRKAPSLTGFQHELACLFDAPRFFTLDEPLKRYLDFLLHELVTSTSPSSNTTGQSDRLAGTLLGCMHARLAHSRERVSGRLDLKRLDHFIDSHLSGQLNVADMAGQACLSEAHFRQCFRRQTGLTPWQYVRRKRLAAARHLLAESQLPVSEVAALTGFTNQSALAHACRNAFGQPPSKLRAAVNHESHASRALFV